MFLENIALMLENDEEMDRLFWDKGQAASAPRSPHESPGSAAWPDKQQKQRGKEKPTS